MEWVWGEEYINGCMYRKDMLVVVVVLVLVLQTGLTRLMRSQFTSVLKGHPDFSGSSMQDIRKQPEK